jgi:hypothetical protein
MRHVVAVASVVILAFCGRALAFQEPTPPAGSGASSVVASRPSAGPGEAEAALREEEQRIQAALQRLLPEVVIRETPLEQALGTLTDGLNINVRVNWTDIADAGLEREAPVTLVLRNLPRWRVLRGVLDAASSETRLGYEVREGVLVVATQEYLDRDQITQVYPVRDLLAAMALKLQREQSPAKSISVTGDSTSERGEPVGRLPMPGTRPAVVLPDVHELFVAQAEQALQELLSRTVVPDSWAETGGGSGTIRIYNGALVVHQCRRAQHEVERVLADLRAAGAGESGPGTPATPKSPDRKAR